MIKKLLTRFNGVIKLGDHLVVLYKSESNISETVVSYISNSLSNNQKCIYINGDTDTELIIESLKTLNLYYPFVETNQLMFLDKKDAYSKGGKFNPTKMKDLLIELSKEAINDGFTGLAISGEISWVLEYDDGFDLINEYEWKINSEVFEKLKKDFDAVIISTGTVSENAEFFGLKATPKGIVADRSSYQTSEKNIFAIGNNVFKVVINNRDRLSTTKKLVEDLLNSVRIKWIATKYGFEKIIMKSNKTFSWQAILFWGGTLGAILPFFIACIES